MFKKFKKLLAILAAAMMVVSLISCGGNNKVIKDEVLEVYIEDHGYRTEGVKAIINAFSEQDWVKEKYPNLEVKFTTNNFTDYAINKISNPKNNEFDLLFTNASLFSAFDKNAKGEYLLVDLKEDVYDQDVIGEPGVKFSEKMHQSFLKDLAYTSRTETVPKYYEVPWVTGLRGIIYNEEILAQFGYVNGKTPNTTDELLQLCKDIKQNPGKSGNGKGYAHINCSGYSDSIDTWWAQYDGYEAYENFWQGKYKDNRGTTYSNKIFNLEGRLKALEVIDEMFKYDNGYYDVESHDAGEFMTRQTRILKGEYALAFCADWFDTEMRSTYELLESEGITPATIKIMKWPVVSAIVDKLETVKTDELLSKVIAAIDEGKTSYDGVSEDDFNRLVEARGIYHTTGIGHVAVIPTCANSKDVAIDALKFMATDLCQEVYMRATYGQNLPFRYNLDTNSELFKGLSSLQQSRLTYFYSSNIKVLPNKKRYPLVRFGNLQPIKSQTTAYGEIFMVKGNVTTPRRLFDDTKAAWTEGVFDFALITAGLKSD